MLLGNFHQAINFYIGRKDNGDSLWKSPFPMATVEYWWGVGAQKCSFSSLCLFGCSPVVCSTLHSQAFQPCLQVDNSPWTITGDNAAQLPQMHRPAQDMLIWLSLKHSTAKLTSTHLFSIFTLTRQTWLSSRSWWPRWPRWTHFSFFPRITLWKTIHQNS